MFIGGGVILSQDDVAILRKGLAANWSMNNIKRDGKEKGVYENEHHCNITL